MAVRFSLYYAALFLVVGVFLPFWPAWLKTRGLDAGQISLILSVAVWLRVLANPVIAHFADRTGAHRTIIMISAAGAAGIYVLFSFVHGFWMLFVINVLASILFMALIPLGENLASRSAVPYGFDYGRVRLWGSITFILAAYLGGAVIGRTGDHIIPWMLAAALAGSFLAASGLPQRQSAGRSGARFPAVALLRNRSFLIFLAAGSLLQASHAVLYVFGTIHWRAAGISDEVIGALWAEGVIAEIILFAFSGAVVARLGPIRLMLIAALAGVVRWTVLAETTDLALLVAVQWLHGLTFGAAHLAAIHYLLRNVPDQMSASAQSLYAGFAVGLVMGLVMLVGGRLYEDAGAVAFHAMTLLSLAGGFAALLLARFGAQPEPSS